MRIIDWERLDRSERQAALERPHQAESAEARRVARRVIAGVRREGDAAVRGFTERYDGIKLKDFRVPLDEFAEARGALSAMQVQALQRAIANVRTFHHVQRLEPLSVQIEPGVLCEQLIRPIEAVGLYVPAGSAPLPSTLIMLAITAEVAGCPQRILCTPPSPQGTAHPAILVAAQLCGIDTVFKVGGAQAIAALAYGTETIPKVDKIFGPGNAWVTAAKQQVAADPHGAACDLPAGPSEVLIIADDRARPDFIAADLLAQAEHDSLSQAILVTPSASLAHSVVGSLERTLPRLARRSLLARSMNAYRCILVEDLPSAIAVANAYAPEHLLLQVQEPRLWLTEVRHAGAIFLGEWSAEPLGDYCSGTNHVLPTYGHARALSGLTVRDFVRTVSVQEISPAGFRGLGPTAVTLAELEGLGAHALAVTRRLDILPGDGS